MHLQLILRSVFFVFAFFHASSGALTSFFIMLRHGYLDDERKQVGELGLRQWELKVVEAATGRTGTFDRH
jgi:hypothetical protein